MNNTLLPCPFCGGEAKIKSRYIGYGSVGLGAHDWYSVECKECRAKGYEYGMEPEAIAAWNRRAQPENKPLTLYELRQMDGCNDGTPIWIEPTGKYEGVWTAAWYIWPWDTKDFEIDTYADAWLAYRSKPKEEV